MKHLLRILFVVATLFSVSVHAGTIVCSGTIEQVHMHASNSMMIRLSGMNTSVHFCNIKEDWSPPGAIGVTSPEMCRTFVAMFMAGKLAGKTIASMYFDTDDAPTTCTSWGNWKNAHIRYFSWAD